jgi:hypothetical protein
MSNSSFTQELRDNGLSRKWQQPSLISADEPYMIDELNIIMLAQQNSPDGLLQRPQCPDLDPNPMYPLYVAQGTFTPTDREQCLQALTPMNFNCFPSKHKVSFSHRV